MECFGSWFIWFPLTISLLYLLRLAMEKLSYGGKLPPGPTPLPILGNLFELGDMPHRSLARLTETYGPVMSLKLGQVTTIVISSPGAAKEVLQLQDKFLSARHVPDAVRALGFSEMSVPWLPPSQEWKHLRTIIRTHLVAADRLDAYQGLRQRKVQELVEHLRKQIGQAVEIRHVAICTIMNEISSSLLSVDLVNFNSDTAHEFKNLVTELMEIVGKPNLSDFFPMFRWIDPQGYRRKATAHLSKLFKIFDEIINKRLQAITQEVKLPDSRHDFLDALLQLHMQEDFKLDRRTIKSILADVFLAGTDTCTTLVEWSMAELLRNPSVMAKAHAELTTVIGPQKQMEESDIARLPYLQAVVKETLRIHPPGPFLLPRKAEKSVVIGGYPVPRNSRVMVNVWAIGHDNTVWEDPESFMPERFLTSEVDFRGRHFEFIPFGSGRRICPGMSLAHQTVHLMLGSLIHSFKWKLPDGLNLSHVELKEKLGVTVALAVPLRAIPLPDAC